MNKGLKIVAVVLIGLLGMAGHAKLLRLVHRHNHQRRCATAL